MVFAVSADMARSRHFFLQQLTAVFNGAHKCDHHRTQLANGYAVLRIFKYTFLQDVSIAAKRHLRSVLSLSGASQPKLRGRAVG
jgi:hypothetical protein